MLLLIKLVNEAERFRETVIDTERGHDTRAHDGFLCVIVIKFPILSCRT
jgi:hypothetical protein